MPSAATKKGGQPPSDDETVREVGGVRFKTFSPVRNFLPYGEAKKSGLDDETILMAVVDGELAAPIIVGGKIFFDAGDWIAFTTRLAHRARRSGLDLSNRAERLA